MHIHPISGGVAPLYIPFTPSFRRVWRRQSHGPVNWVELEVWRRTFIVSKGWLYPSYHRSAGCHSGLSQKWYSIPNAQFRQTTKDACDESFVTPSRLLRHAHCALFIVCRCRGSMLQYCRRRHVFYHNSHLLCTAACWPLSVPNVEYIVPLIISNQSLHERHVRGPA